MPSPRLPHLHNQGELVGWVAIFCCRRLSRGKWPLFLMQRLNHSIIVLYSSNWLKRKKKRKRKGGWGGGGGRRFDHSKAKGSSCMWSFDPSFYKQKYKTCAHAQKKKKKKKKKSTHTYTHINSQVKPQCSLSHSRLNECPDLDVSLERIKFLRQALIKYTTLNLVY